jgi:tRNA nucleotidyltransferase (CCA-adding enzyme)
VATLPPGRELRFDALPPAVAHVLARIADAGYEAALVGGCVRDPLMGVVHEGDWDAATSARPETVAELFPGATWENRFGTVTVRDTPSVEVTSYRADEGYRDRRRPDEVRFGVALPDDLARRDFTINAMAWLPTDLEAGLGLVVDPFGGEADIGSRRLRTVGDPRQRFDEDALRLVRAARFAGRFELTIDPATEAAIMAMAPLAASVSHERIRDELFRILELSDMPSRTFLLMESLGLLGILFPEVAALRGVPQRKARPGDALDHTLAAVDAAAGLELRLTALLHDLGKATTLADGHFIGHERVGAELAGALLARLRVPGQLAGRVQAVIAHHMYDYGPDWTDAAVRRFIRRTDGVDRTLLFGLRRVDNAASGVGPDAEEVQAELEARIAAELSAQPELLVGRRLAIDGHDLQRELGLPAGPELGRVLDQLTEAVLDDPSLNRRDRLLAMAERVVLGRTG